MIDKLCMYFIDKFGPFRGGYYLCFFLLSLWFLVTNELYSPAEIMANLLFVPFVTAFVSKRASYD